MLQVTVTATERRVRNPPSRSTPLVGRSNQRLSDTQCEREGNRVGTWETRSGELCSLGAGGSSLTQTQEGWRRNRRAGSRLLGEEQVVREVWHAL